LKVYSSGICKAEINDVQSWAKRVDNLEDANLFLSKAQSLSECADKVIATTTKIENRYRRIEKNVCEGLGTANSSIIEANSSIRKAAMSLQAKASKNEEQAGDIVRKYEAEKEDKQMQWMALGTIAALGAYGVSDGMSTADAMSMVGQAASQLDIIKPEYLSAFDEINSTLHEGSNFNLGEEWIKNDLRYSSTSTDSITSSMTSLGMSQVGSQSAPQECDAFGFCRGDLVVKNEGSQEIYTEQGSFGEPYNFSCHRAYEQEAAQIKMNKACASSKYEAP